MDKYSLHSLYVGSEGQPREPQSWGLCFVGFLHPLGFIPKKWANKLIKKKEGLINVCCPQLTESLFSHL